jgi:hypothetical protein
VLKAEHKNIRTFKFQKSGGRSVEDVESRRVARRSAFGAAKYMSVGCNQYGACIGLGVGSRLTSTVWYLLGPRWSPDNLDLHCMLLIRLTARVLLTSDWIRQASLPELRP